MPNKPPPAPPKGTRHPGAGRARGTPNRITVAFKTLLGEMVGDPAYQWRLRRDFRARKVHPTIEAMVWAYHAGKPKTEIELSGNLGISRELEDDRQKLRTLGLTDLQALAAASQALVDQAFERAMDGRLLEARPLDVVVEALRPKAGAESLGKQAGSDSESSVNVDDPIISGAISPADAAGYHTIEHDEHDDTKET